MSQFLTVRYDVTDWTDNQIDALTGEAIVQAEASDDHPTCEVTTSVGTSTAELEAHWRALTDEGRLQLMGLCHVYCGCLLKPGERCYCNRDD